MNFRSTAHKLCLYHVTFDGIPIFIFCQVDDFSVAAPNPIIANNMFGLLQAGLKQPLKLLGTLTMYNFFETCHSQTVTSNYSV